MRKAEIQEAVGKAIWFHTMDLNGTIVKGRVSMEAERWVSQVIPNNLEGKKVLDIGAFDGYYSFLCEKRGATVTAIDVDPTHQANFELARKCLDCKTPFHVLSVYDLQQLPDDFDYILFFGVLYHLTHPILALEKIKQKLRGKMFLESSYIITPRSSADFVWNREKFPLTYWRPSASCIKRMCELAGFQSVQTVAKRWFLPWRRGRILMTAE
jgi:tRNA (mo5U34)-methyltransferase